MSFLKKILPAAVTLVLVSTASATVIDFDSIATPLNVVFGHPNYSEDGFQFSGGQLATFGAANNNYAGSAGLFQNMGGATTTFTKSGGGSFAFNSIDLSEGFKQASYSIPISVAFTANLVGGGTASYTATLDLVFGYQTFNFGSIFASVTSVSWVGSGSQFDNLVVNASVPEGGSSVALLGGVLAACAVMRRKFARA